MKNPLLAPELREYIANDDAGGLREFCEQVHPAAFADFLTGLEPDEMWQVLKRLTSKQRVAVFNEIDADFQTEIAILLRRDELGTLVTDMPPDDRVDFLKRMPEEKRDAILPALAQAEREDIKRLSAYPEGTAGAIMTTEYAAIRPDITAAEAIGKLRHEAPDKETIYYAYVLDESRKLVGFISLKDLILARPDVRVADIMHGDVISAAVDEDQEAAARKLQKFDLIALPVVDAAGRLVGIITHDDAFDVIVQEQTEDMEKLVAIGGAHEAAAYIRTPAWMHFKNRCGWIIVLAFLGLVSGAIVQSFEGLLVQFAILATFMPMLADTGGNTGSQSATLIVRALALGEVTTRDVLRVLLKELLVSLPMGLLLAFFAFGRVMLFGGAGGIPDGFSPATVGLAVGVALGIQVVTATLIGAMLPLAAARMKLDPAVVASPAITTIVDITGLLIFFMTAGYVLGF
ncbi:MAG TPA: magnesium transporter [Planctomycetes bacterium]|mgnify:CR=1 FL=1|nr:magnesium transporter [Planctomycetota bacterium]